MTAEQVLLRELNKEYLGKTIRCKVNQNETFIVNRIAFDHNYGDCEIWFYGKGSTANWVYFSGEELPETLSNTEIIKKDSGFIHPYKK